MITPFTVSGTVYCTASDIEYTAAVTADSSQDITFITFDATTLKILWTSP